MGLGQAGTGKSQKKVVKNDYFLNLSRRATSTTTQLPFSTFAVVLYFDHKQKRGVFTGQQTSRYCC